MYIDKLLLINSYTFVVLEQTKIFFIAVGSVTTTIAAIIILIIFLSLTGT